MIHAIKFNDITILFKCIDKNLIISSINFQFITKFILFDEVITSFYVSLTNQLINGNININNQRTDSLTIIVGLSNGDLCLGRLELSQFMLIDVESYDKTKLLNQVIVSKQRINRILSSDLFKLILKSSNTITLIKIIDNLVYVSFFDSINKLVILSNIWNDIKTISVIADLNDQDIGSITSLCNYFYPGSMKSLHCDCFMTKLLNPNQLWLDEQKLIIYSTSNGFILWFSLPPIDSVDIIDIPIISKVLIETNQSINKLLLCNFSANEVSHLCIIQSNRCINCLGIRKDAIKSNVYYNCDLTTTLTDNITINNQIKAYYKFNDIIIYLYDNMLYGCQFSYFNNEGNLLTSLPLLNKSCQTIENIHLSSDYLLYIHLNNNSTYLYDLNQYYDVTNNNFNSIDYIRSLLGYDQDTLLSTQLIKNQNDIIEINNKMKFQKNNNINIKNIINEINIEILQLSKILSMSLSDSLVYNFKCRTVVDDQNICRGLLDITASSNNYEVIRAINGYNFIVNIESRDLIHINEYNTSTSYTHKLQFNQSNENQYSCTITISIDLLPIMDYNISLMLVIPFHKQSSNNDIILPSYYKPNQKSNTMLLHEQVLSYHTMHSLKLTTHYNNYINSCLVTKQSINDCLDIFDNNASNNKQISNSSYDMIVNVPKFENTRYNKIFNMSDNLNAKISSHLQSLASECKIIKQNKSDGLDLIRPKFISVDSNMFTDRRSLDIFYKINDLENTIEYTISSNDRCLLINTKMFISNILLEYLNKYIIESYENIDLNINFEPKDLYYLPSNLQKVFDEVLQLSKDLKVYISSDNQNDTERFDMTNLLKSNNDTKNYDSYILLQDIIYITKAASELWKLYLILRQYN